MKYNQVIITPEDLDALSNVVLGALESESSDADRAYKWVAYVRSVVYTNWLSLPDGNHLKSAYADDVWSWDDSDLSNALINN